MSVAVSITNVDFTGGNQLLVSGTLTLTGNYGGASTHGDTLSFLGFDQVKSSSPPTAVDIFEVPAAGTSATGFTYNFSPGTTQGNGVLQVFGTGSAAGNAAQEYTEASAYSAPLLAAKLSFRAWFPSV